MQRLNIEIVFAVPEKQSLISLQVDAGVNVADVIASSGIADAYPEYDFATLSIGIWGHKTDRQHIVEDGDRVEIYRPLRMNPREARRQLALAGRTMRDSG